MTVSRRICAGYSLGSLVTGSFSTVPGLLLLPYLTDSLAVPAATAGLLVLLPKAWDVIFNPVAGRISDRRGPRRPLLLQGGVALAVLFAALFALPAGGGVYVGVVFLLCATAYAFFQVPYVAMMAEITTDYDQRTRLMTWRMAILAVAILLSGAGAPAIRDATGGYHVMGIVVGLLILIGTVTVYVGTRGVATSGHMDTGAGFSELFAAVRQSREFRRLLVVFVIQAAGVSTLLAGVDYMSRVVLRDSGMQTLLFAAFVGPALLVMPMWQRVGTRYGKRAGFIVSSIIFAVPLAFCTLAQVVPAVVVVVLAAFTGVGYSGMQVFPMAMLPDVITAEEQRSGARRAGLFSGVWTAGETLGFAVGPGIYGIILAAGGYVSSTDAAVAQPQSAVTAALIGFAVVPVALVLVALPLLTKKLEVRV
ncbi:MFS transporter [Kibdelosporangium phytohabitans]|uniref:MFS transporter n=1 Tax=Kibdelosporangium phytohabitans TaxID=860235 RepID=A0A0N9IDC9_9PSEU|nr:MFS transporter [Kibdelosporangium phytohabitans]ALG12729.1 MFS transporter [Kibdelosporangium phytohabitans]MBE1464400.1 Na+/melibiose symporter-like transporter [Kibdelosporangium phytohabitans]